MVGDLSNLVVTISTDLKDFQKGLAQAQKELQSAAKGMTLALGAVTAAFTAGVMGAVKYGEEIYKLSETTGISAENISRLKYAAEQNEMSFGSLTTGLRMFSRNIYEANSGNAALQKSFSDLGIAARDFKGMQIDQSLLAISDRFKQITDPAEKAALAMQLFGRGGAEIIPLLSQGSEELSKFFKQADTLGITLSGKDAQAFDDFGDNLSKMKSYLTGIWIEIANKVMPEINNFFSALQKSNLLKDVAKGLQEVLATITALPAWLKLAAAAWVLFGTAMGRSVSMILLIPDTGRLLAMVFAAVEEQILKAGKELANFVLTWAQILHLPIPQDWLNELEKMKTDLQQALDVNELTKQNLSEKPLFIENILNDLNVLNTEIENFKTNVAATSVTLPTINTAPAKDELQKFVDEAKNILGSFKGSWTSWSEELKTTWKGTVTAIETNLGSAISSMIQGTKSFSEAVKEFWKDLATAVIDQISQMIAKWLVFQALASASGVGGWLAGLFHEGGEVMHAGGLIRAHGGLSLAPDEVPIIAQTGEGILSRRGMAALGGSGALDFLNQGRSVGNTYIINNNLEGAIISSEMDVDDLSNKLGLSVKRALRTI